MLQLTRYTHADFADDDSVNSVQLAEGISSTGGTRIRYQTGSSMWEQRSLLEKALLVLVATLLFVIMVLTIILHSAEDRLAVQRVIKVLPTPVRACLFLQLQVINVHTDQLPCLNESCIHIASTILEAMNSSIDPCDDFYSYACDGWIKNNPIPDGKSSWGTFMKLEQQNQQVIKKVLEQPIETFKSKAEQKAKMYYESCLDLNYTIEDLGAKPMLQLLKELGGWNVTESGFNVSQFSLQTTLQKVQNK